MNKWFPTNKWWTATTVAVGSIVGLIWVGDGVNTDEEKYLVVSLVVQRVVAYWTRNDLNGP